MIIKSYAFKTVARTTFDRPGRFFYNNQNDFHLCHFEGVTRLRNLNHMHREGFLAPLEMTGGAETAIIHTLEMANAIRHPPQGKKLLTPRKEKHRVHA